MRLHSKRGAITCIISILKNTFTYRTSIPTSNDRCNWSDTSWNLPLWRRETPNCFQNLFGPVGSLRMSETGCNFGTPFFQLRLLCFGRVGTF